MNGVATNDYSRSVSIFLRSIEIWFVISIVEVLHGVARIALLEPLVGDFRARQIAVFTGSVLILAVTYLFRRWIDATSVNECLEVGTVWGVLTIGFEVVLGRLILQASWQRILSDYDLLHGGLMPLGLLVMLFAPLVISKWARR